MAIYVDEAIWPWQGRKWCHLLADEIDELHRFANSLGLHRASYQGRRKQPHRTTTSHRSNGAARSPMAPVPATAPRSS